MIDPSLIHIPPQNVEAEASILSAMLIDPESAVGAIDLLNPEDFYKSSHKYIFDACRGLQKRHDPVDIVTVTAELRKRKQLEQVGGATYVSYLVDETPMAVNLESYAKIVRQKAALRNTIRICNDITKRCFEDSDDSELIIDDAQQKIMGIECGFGNDNIVKLMDTTIGVIDDLEERSQNRNIVTGIETGFSSLDGLTGGFQNSDLDILAARPGIGKSAMMINMATHQSERGIPVGIFSLEMPTKQLCLRALAGKGRIDSHKLRSGYFTREDWINITDAASGVDDMPLYINDTGSLHYMELRRIARKMKQKLGIKILYIDYIQLMRGDTKGTRDQEIGSITRSLKAMAKELDIPIIALSQLNRKLEERGDKRPRLSDLRESGSLEQDADIVMFIYRDEIYNKNENNPNRGKAELDIAKHRNGPTAHILLTFLKAYTRFENMALEY